MKRKLTNTVLIGCALFVAQLAVRIYLYFRPHITPPFVMPLLNHSLRRWYHRHTLQSLALQHGQRVLEIGGGTGVFTFDLAAQITPGLLCTTDLQTPMVRALVRRVDRVGRSNIAVVRADAQALPFKRHSFDAAIMIAVLPMLRDRQRALRETLRVLRLGGHLLVSEEVIAPEYVPPAVTRRWLRRAEFTIVDQCLGLWCYSVVADKL